MFLITVTKYLTRSNLRARRGFLGSLFRRLQHILFREAWWQEPLWLWQRKQEWQAACPHLRPGSRYLTEDEARTSTSRFSHSASLPPARPHLPIENHPLETKGSRKESYRGISHLKHRYQHKNSYSSSGVSKFLHNRRDCKVCCCDFDGGHC